jgi:hypothetical protein
MRQVPAQAWPGAHVCVGRVVGNCVAGLGIARVVGTSVGVAVGRAVGAFVGARVGAKLQSRSARSQLHHPRAERACECVCAWACVCVRGVACVMCVRA